MIAKGQTSDNVTETSKESATKSNGLNEIHEKATLLPSQPKNTFSTVSEGAKLGLFELSADLDTEAFQ